jgi:hypothetical protein
MASSLSEIKSEHVDGIAEPAGFSCRRVPSGPPRKPPVENALEAEERVTTWMMFFFTAARLRSC